MNVPRPLWLTRPGPESDVVLSTRCRIARNLTGHCFPWRATDADRRSAAEKVLLAVDRAGTPFRNAIVLRADDLSPEDAATLVEWRYASRDWVRGGSDRWLVIVRAGDTSLLVNEEDHCRLQTVLPGLQVESAVGMACDAEAALATSLVFARSEHVGFLTASPSNAGGGLRVSALLHLAGLYATGDLPALLEAAEGTGCAVRGLYGEGTEGTGGLFQVSNTRVCGIDVRQVFRRVSVATGYLVQAERRARRKAFGDGEGRCALRDGAAHALKVLFGDDVSPRSLVSLVSVLRLAAVEGLLPVRPAQVDELIALAGAAGASGGNDAGAARFEAVRRSAALRSRLRYLIEEGCEVPGPTSDHAH